MTPEQFIKKWAAAALSERSAAQQHFLDLCQLLGEAPPAEADPTGETFTFEKGGTTATGGHGWADVWKQGAFAWEYKGPGKDLNAAYLQLKKYADMLQNPPLLITSDTKRIEIHTNFTNTVKTVHTLELADLADSGKREVLRAAFTNPEKLRPGTTRHQVTTEAAERFSVLAHHLQNKGYDPQRVAHFLNRLMFCMFAEDVGLLPNRIFTKMAIASVAHPEAFEANAKQLFAGMAKGGAVAFEVIDWFNGGLFEDDSTLPLDAAELKLVLQCAELDWSNIEPSIFGTLFERGLDPDKRSQQGAHYTDPETIMKIVNPVVLQPWEREWEAEKADLATLIDRAKKSVSKAAIDRVNAFLERLMHFCVLDPACGSGNFLYLALRGLKDFEKKVIHEAEALGLPPQFPRVGPEAVKGIEVNPYAAELARVTIWIGELQWMIENGFGASKNPILKPLEQIECRDAIVDADGSEPAWPTANVIVGNPPFLGNKKLIRELGEEYVARVRRCYMGRVPDGVDLCCYWFERARSQLESRRAERAGLVATNSIRGGTSRKVLESLLTAAVIFDAWSDEPWVNEGAAVRVSLISFAPSWPENRKLDGAAVASITADLSGQGTNWSNVKALPENAGVAFQGAKFVGAFDIPAELANRWMALPKNPNGRSNSEVLRRWINGMDIVRRPVERWVIDFGVDRSETEAALFEAPFTFLEENVKGGRQGLRETRAGARWWLHQRPRPEMRDALQGRSHYIATAEVSKHRIFVFVDARVLPSGSVYAITRNDWTCFGILSSSAHTLWALKVGTQLEDRPRYTISTTFEAFPFPIGLGLGTQAADYAADDRAIRIANAAKQLDGLRENWLNPADLVVRRSESMPGYPDRILPKTEAVASELAKRTLTNLYNTNPTWLQHAHKELDEAVAAAYEWEWPLSDEEVLKRLFALNQRRAAALVE